MLLWSFKAMKEKQLFWTAFCVFSLLENHISGESTTTSSRSLSPSISSTESISPNISSAAEKLAITSNTEAVSTTKVTPLTVTSRKLTENSTSETNVTSNPETYTHAATSTDTIVQTSPTQQSTSGASGNITTQNITSPPLLTTVSPEQTQPYSSALPNTTNADDKSVMPNIKCMNIKEVTTSKVICLELNETHTCEQFVKRKGAVLEQAVCKEEACHIKLAESSVNHNCILLLEANNKGADALNEVLEKDRSALSKLGVKSYKQDSIESHKDYSRKTLIALVTSGLLLAFLGLAGYHLMKRRSWSPMGERLGEDPYYTENDSHGDPVISAASHEHSDLQDKPNINGGARENGTGQANSKNGQSARPHVADTEL
ncbi:hematopoietic progenitor cell antigen CD34 [Elgaria multicarinata webbii]|uniref:hematopoietic progenitor cell antigen CD34 n=1 Tax=Elgaria multicarinata webbii TaxID=159646 RepID=UPI002FCD66A4